MKRKLEICRRCPCYSSISGFLVGEKENIMVCHKTDVFYKTAKEFEKLELSEYCVMYVEYCMSEWNE